MAFFAILAIVMVIGSYLFVALLAAGSVYLPYIIFSRAQSDHGWDVLILLFGILIAATMLWSLIPRRQEFTAPGLLLERSRHPSLFAEIENIAAALNEPVPHDVYLIGDANAFVADRGGVMGFGTHRIMGLGLPLLSTMTVSSFAPCSPMNLLTITAAIPVSVLGFTEPKLPLSVSSKISDRSANSPASLI